MFDIRWAMMRALCWGLQRVGHGGGRFVFAVAAQPESERGRVSLAVADTTAIPSGPAVRALVDHVVGAHVDAAIRRLTGDARIPDELREAMKSAGIDIKHDLPARSWRVDEVGQA